jgi:hypothetical protein
MPYLNQKPIFIKIANDPRVTRVGRFIRKYSIDELPQLMRQKPSPAMRGLPGFSHRLVLPDTGR